MLWVQVAGPEAPAGVIGNVPPLANAVGYRGIDDGGPVRRGLGMKRERITVAFVGEKLLVGAPFGPVSI